MLKREIVKAKILESGIEEMIAGEITLKEKALSINNNPKNSNNIGGTINSTGLVPTLICFHRSGRNMRTIAIEK